MKAAHHATTALQVLATCLLGLMAGFFFAFSSSSARIAAGRSPLTLKRN